MDYMILESKNPSLHYISRRKDIGPFWSIKFRIGIETVEQDFISHTLRSLLTGSITIRHQSTSTNVLHDKGKISRWPIAVCFDLKSKDSKIKGFNLLGKKPNKTSN